MIAQKNIRNLQIAATVVLGSLSIATFSSGFFLIYADYISASDFFSGVGIGLASASAMASISACAMSSRFFNKSVVNDSDPLINDNVIIEKYTTDEKLPLRIN